ncbi:RDD family protein [Pleionea sp. CnH1-48]|uniref:RDD family protein n=1 Tax=Pleionea sp. CnH1-48 TaxID=2954494 RepID=UPI0020971923|nr:RDD family protein [Pleionea sp. CnH1-48]MCO7224679.1 RDD family protein [Pleionea sp. CnH1-48]
MLDTSHTVEIPEGIELSLPVASPLERILAYMIDAVVQLVILIIIGNVFSLFGNFGAGIFAVLYFLLNWFYAVFFEMFNDGATPGKKAMGILVVNDDGTPVSWAASIVRNLLRFADAFPGFHLFGVTCMFLNSNFKRLGDLAAGTIVIHRKKEVQEVVIKEVKAEAPDVSLLSDEQSAILHFGERIDTLSKDRCNELTDILAPMLKADSSEKRMNKVLAIANWLRGRR